MRNMSVAARNYLVTAVSFAFIGGWCVSKAQAESKTLAAAMPSGAIAYAEVSELASVLARMQDSEYRQMALASPQFQAVQNSTNYQKAEAVRQIIETQLGMDLWTLGEKLLGGRIAVGLYPKSGQQQPDGVVLIRVADQNVLARIQERLAPFVTLLAGNQLDTSDTVAGQSVITVRGRTTTFLAVHTNWVAAASNRELLAKSIGLLKGSETGSLAEDKPFQVMTGDLGERHLVRAYMNTEMLSEAIGGRFSPKKLANPLASLLFGGIMELAVGSPYAGATLDVQQQQFLVTTGVAGQTSQLNDKYQSFFSDPTTSGTNLIPDVAGLIGGVTLFRGFADWYRRRDELLRDDVLPGFDKFEAGLGNLLPGRDFGEDVLPMMGNRLTFVAALQDYSHLDGAPGVKLPSFGLIVELAKPQEGGDIIQLFFQTLSSILNIQAGQQGRQPWVMASESYKDVQISYGRYLKKPIGDRLPLVFNFMPAAGRVGDKYVICSSLDLCRKLIDRLTNPTAEHTRENKNFNFEFHVEPFAEIVQANEQFFKARSVQGGRELKDVQTEFETVINIIRSWDGLKLSTNIKPDTFQVQLSGSWK